MKTNRYNPFIEHQQQQVPLAMQQQMQPEEQTTDASDNTPIDFFAGVKNDLGVKPTIEKEEEEDPDKKKGQQQQQQKKTEDPPTKNDDRPDFTREKKKEKPNKEESMEILRAQRDEFKTKYDELVSKIGDEDSEAIGDYVAHLKEQIGGPLTKQNIKDYLTSSGATKSQIKELTEQVQEYEKKLTHYDINHSPEFLTNYRKPMEEAYENLLYQFATPIEGRDGQISYVAPNATKKLNDFLVQDPEKAKFTPANITTAIRSFMDEYKKESGEDAPPVNVASVLQSLRIYNEKRYKLSDAVSNWKDTQAREAAAFKAKQEADKEAAGRVSKRERMDQSTKAYRSYDHDTFDGLVEENILQGIFNDEYDFAEKLYSGSEVPPMQDLYKRGADARLFRHLIDSGIFEEMKELYFEKHSNSELRGNGGKPQHTRQNNNSGDKTMGESILGNYALR